MEQFAAHSIQENALNYYGLEAVLDGTIKLPDCFHATNNMDEADLMSVLNLGPIDDWGVVQDSLIDSTWDLHEEALVPAVNLAGLKDVKPNVQVQSSTDKWKRTRHPKKFHLSVISTYLYYAKSSNIH